MVLRFYRFVFWKRWRKFSGTFFQTFVALSKYLNWTWIMYKLKKHLLKSDFCSIHLYLFWSLSITIYGRNNWNSNELNFRSKLYVYFCFRFKIPIHKYLINILDLPFYCVSTVLLVSALKSRILLCIGQLPFVPRFVLIESE